MKIEINSNIGGQRIIHENPFDGQIELVLATKENTRSVGWLITDEQDAIKEECSIPFYATVKEGANLSDADWKDQPVVRQAQISWRDDMSISWMERHMEMTQGFMLVGSNAPALMILGDPTHDRNDLTEEERAWPDFDRVKGYIIPPGCGIIIKKGTWHDFPISVGPVVTVFIMNTREVVDALSSMKEPAPMDFGDCYKVRLTDKYGEKKKCFPDPRPFLASLGLTSGIEDKNLDFKAATVCTIFSQGSLTSMSSSESLTNDPKEDKDKHEDSSSEYGKGMQRVEVGIWGGPDCNKVWVVPVINVESFDPQTFGPSVQPHLNKTQPELANKGWRDYGNKRGLNRLGKMFNHHEIPCTAVVSSDLVKNEQVMSLLYKFEKEKKWEIGAHGANNSNAGHVGLSEEEETDAIVRSLGHLGNAFPGREPTTWLTPGFSVTHSTPKLLFKAGIETLLDFVDDDVPFKLVYQEDGSRSPELASETSLVCLPYSMETNDFSLVLTRHLSPREYAAALESHISQLAEESRESGIPNIVCLGMHTFVAGTPAHVYELNKMLNRLKSNENVKWATAKEATESISQGCEFNAVSKENTSVPLSQPKITSQLANNHLSIDLTPSGMMQVDPNNIGLLLIDFQNDFMSHGGFGEGLGNDPMELHHVIEPTREVLSSFRDAGLPVIHTREGHRPNLSDITPLKAGDGTLIGSHGQKGRSMVRGQWGNDIIDELKPRVNETIIDKPGKGSFFQTDLDLILRNAGIDTLVVCGVTTEICVHSTVREANDRGIQCIVLEDCTASYFNEFHKVGLEMIRAQGGILGRVSNSKLIVNALENKACARK